MCIQATANSRCLNPGFRTTNRYSFFGMLLLSNGKVSRLRAREVIPRPAIPARCSVEVPRHLTSAFWFKPPLATMMRGEGRGCSASGSPSRNLVSRWRREPVEPRGNPLHFHTCLSQSHGHRGKFRVRASLGECLVNILAHLGRGHELPSLVQRISLATVTNIATAITGQYSSYFWHRLL